MATRMLVKSSGRNEYKPVLNVIQSNDNTVRETVPARIPLRKRKGSNVNPKFASASK